MSDSTSYENWLINIEAKDPILWNLISKFGMLSPTKRNPTFASICEIIVGQQLSGSAARTIFKRLVSVVEKGELSPDNVLKLSSNQLKGVGLSGQKASFLLQNAQMFVERPNYFDELKNLSDAILESELKKLRGVGPWTAQIFMMSCCGRDNVFPEGDATLEKMVSLLYGVSPSQQQVEFSKLSELWFPYRSYAARYFWKEADSGSR